MPCALYFHSYSYRLDTADRNHASNITMTTVLHPTCFSLYYFIHPFVWILTRQVTICRVSSLLSSQKPRFKQNNEDRASSFMFLALILHTSLRMDTDQADYNLPSFVTPLITETMLQLLSSQRACFNSSHRREHASSNTMKTVLHP